jgi:large repetitive protein
VYSGVDGHLLFNLTGESAGDGFGIGVADAGDADRDGAADLIVGAWQHASGALSGGKVYLYSGRMQKLLTTYTCRTPGDTFGFDTTNLGDVDGDGAIDFLVTSAWSGVNGFQSGRVFVLAGPKPAQIRKR